MLDIGCFSPSLAYQRYTCLLSKISGKDLKKEMHNINVLYDLPLGHELRSKLLSHKDTMEDLVDEFLGLVYDLIFHNLPEAAPHITHSIRPLKFSFEDIFQYSIPSCLRINACTDANIDKTYEEIAELVRV